MAWSTGRVKADVEISAKRAAVLAETRVAQTIIALDGLVAQGVNSCSQAHIEAMRGAVLVTAPIKGIAVLGAGDQPLCTHIGLSFGLRKIISSESLEGAAGYTLEVIELGNEVRITRLRRPLPGESAYLAAVIPSELLVPQILPSGGR